MSPAEENMRVPRLASLAVAAILTLPAGPLLPAAAAAGQTGGLLSGEHIITTLYAYPGISLWNLVTGNAPTAGASIVDMCAADGVRVTRVPAGRPVHRL